MQSQVDTLGLRQNSALRYRSCIPVPSRPNQQYAVLRYEQQPSRRPGDWVWSWKYNGTAWMSDSWAFLPSRDYPRPGPTAAWLHVAWRLGEHSSFGDVRSDRHPQAIGFWPDHPSFQMVLGSGGGRIRLRCRFRSRRCRQNSRSKNQVSVVYCEKSCTVR